MPNWVKGNIRLRGRASAIIDFLKNEIVSCSYFGGKILEHATLFEYEDDECIIKQSPECHGCGWFYIKGTQRNFMEGDMLYVYLENEGVETVCIDGFKAAWQVLPEPYIEKSKKYGIDIKIVGFELGMQFMATVDVSDGVLIQNEEKKFDDWYWDCPMPNMGG